MNQNIDALLQQFHMPRKLGVVALGGLESLLAFQFDHAQELASRSSDRLRNTLSQSANAFDHTHLPTLMQKWASGANSLMHDSILSGIDYQREILRLMQAQAEDASEAISESIRRQIPDEQDSNRGQRLTKNADLRQVKSA